MGSGRGAAGPALRAARAPGGCSRASGSSTSSRSRSARGPWRCTTPSRSSRTASPSTARSSSSARTTSSANTPSASPSGHILPGAGPGGGQGLPRSRERERGAASGVCALRGLGGRPGPGAWEGAGRMLRPVAIFPGAGGGCALGRGASGRSARRGRGGFRALSARRVCVRVCFSVSVCGRGGGGRGSGLGAGRSPLPLSSSLLSLDAGAERVASLEGTRGRIGVRVGVSAGWRRARARA